MIAESPRSGRAGEPLNGANRTFATGHTRLRARQLTSQASEGSSKAGRRPTVIARRPGRVGTPRTRNPRVGDRLVEGPPPAIVRDNPDSPDARPPTARRRRLV